MRGGRAQIAIEYLFIMGFALLITAPLVAVYFDQAGQLGEESTTAQVARAAAQITEAADTVYYLGPGSVRTHTVVFPENVAALDINGSAVTFSVLSSSGTYEHPAWSAANLSGSFTFTPGPHVLVFTAQNDSTVAISER